MPLTTPFGEIVVEMNGNQCEYTFEKLPKESPILKVEGRYKIMPLVDEPLPFPMKLKCRLETDLVFDDLTGLETGERYAAASMYHGGLKLCIGSMDDLDEVYEHGNGWCRVIDSGLFLYDFTTSGLEIHVREREYWKYAFFCVAWTTLRGEDHNTNGDYDVWFAAEPLMA